MYNFFSNSSISHRPIVSQLIYEVVKFRTNTVLKFHLVYISTSQIFRYILEGTSSQGFSYIAFLFFLFLVTSLPQHQFPFNSVPQCARPALQTCLSFSLRHNTNFRGYRTTLCTTSCMTNSLIQEHNGHD